MITDAIKNLPEQFKYEPEIKNSDKLDTHDSYVIGGMGGSGLVAGIIRTLKPELDVAVHHEYGLPKFLGKDAGERLFIAISYSGNTEETIDFLESAIKAKYPVAAISTGGKLMQIAEKNDVPFIQLPDTGIQPRMSLGFMTRAVLKLVGEDALYNESAKLANILDPASLEEAGKALAKALADSVPVIYSSRKNLAIAYNWKIKFNETGKIPAFYNTLPELNHNEMTGFDVNKKTRKLSENMRVVILRDTDDHPRIKERMEVLESLYKGRGLTVITVELEGSNRMEKLFSALALADWAAFYTAEYYGNESEEVPMIEEFKKLIA